MQGKRVRTDTKEQREDTKRRIDELIERNNLKDIDEIIEANKNLHLLL